VGIADLSSLVGPQVTESICAPAVPCGAATEAAERAAGVTLDPVSEEQDVRSVLQRVITRNVDAGLVYVTDVRAADGQVQGIDFPQATAPGAAQNYLIGAVAGSPNADLAASWIRFVTGPQGDAALQQAGFALQ
jgi:molybdate transport system substrate-binding protein